MLGYWGNALEGVLFTTGGLFNGLCIHNLYMGVRVLPYPVKGIGFA